MRLFSLDPLQFSLIFRIFKRIHIFAKFVNAMCFFFQALWKFRNIHGEAWFFYGNRIPTQIKKKCIFDFYMYYYQTFASGLICRFFLCSQRTNFATVGGLKTGSAPDGIPRKPLMVCGEFLQLAKTLRIFQCSQWNIEYIIYISFVWICKGCCDPFTIQKNISSLYFKSSIIPRPPFIQKPVFKKSQSIMSKYKNLQTLRHKVPHQRQATSYRRW